LKKSTRILTLENFDIVLEEFKNLQQKRIKSKHERFQEVIDFFKLAKPNKSPSILYQDKLDRFNKIISDLFVIKDLVIDQRIKETKVIISQNPEIFRLSTFELMEHNFRENTHSNILRYLFDYNMIGDVAIEILSKILTGISSKGADQIVEKLRQKKYSVEREVLTENGRMDLFFVDETNRFTIVIENKINAKVALKSSESPEKNQYTQLDEYKNFVDKQFPSFDKLFILLSHRPQENDFPPYIIITYNQLSQALFSVLSEDPILSEYKILLRSFSFRNKIRLVTLMKSILNKNNNRLRVCELEIIKQGII